jgi:hypothetical protein
MSFKMSVAHAQNLNSQDCNNPHMTLEDHSVRNTKGVESKTAICLCAAFLAALILGVIPSDAQSPPKPPGKLVDLGGHKLHINCSGKGSPPVVVENGLGDFSFDWVLVQKRVSPISLIEMLQPPLRSMSDDAWRNSLHPMFRAIPILKAEPIHYGVSGSERADDR